MSTTANAAPRPLLWTFLFVGAALAVLGFPSFFDLYTATKWPTAEGEIRRAEIVEQDGYFYVQVEYEFTVDGIEYQGDDVYLRPQTGGISVSAETMGSESRVEAEEILDEFALGKRVRVHYEPGNPSRAALRIETTGILIISCFGLLLALFMWLPLKFPRLFQSARERVSTDSLPRFDRPQIVFSAEMLGDLADAFDSAATAGQSMSDTLLSDSEYSVECWRPGELVRFVRREGGVLSKRANYEVRLDWGQDELGFGPTGSAESIPLAAIQELRVHGKREIRSRGGGRSGSSQSYEAWDVWLDAIVGSRRIRLAGRSNFLDPDEAFRASLRSAAALAMALGVPLRWVGFEEHADYYPPQSVPALDVTTYASSASSHVDRSAGEPQTDSTATSIGAHEQQTTAKPPNTDIAITQAADRFQATIPRIGRLRHVPGLGIAVVFGLFAAMISPAAFGNPELGPRIFVGLLWLVPVACLVQAARQWARSGAIEASGDELIVLDRGLFRTQRHRWSISRDLLTVCVVPTGKEHHGLPIEQLAAIGVDGTPSHFFQERSNRELAWLAQSLRQFLGFPEPPAVTQSDPQKAVLEISRGLANSLYDEMDRQVVDMEQTHRRLTATTTKTLSTPEARLVDAALEEMDAQIAECETRLSRSELDLVRAEFGLIDFETWQPGEVVLFRHETLDTRSLISNSFLSGLGYGLVFLFVVPFVVPIAGTILVIPIDLIGAKRLHFVLADLMGFGAGLIAWIATFTVLAMVWVYLKLDAAFAPREVEFDWRQRRMSVRTRRDDRSYAFRDIRRIVVRDVKSAQADERKRIARIEAELADENVILLEADESDEIDGLAEPAMPVEVRLKALAADLAHHLDVKAFLIPPVDDDYDAVGYPRNPRLSHLGLLWKNVSSRSRLLVSCLCVAILLFWSVWAIQSYRVNADVDAAVTGQFDAGEKTG